MVKKKGVKLCFREWTAHDKSVAGLAALLSFEGCFAHLGKQVQQIDATLSDVPACWYSLPMVQRWIISRHDCCDRFSHAASRECSPFLLPAPRTWTSHDCNVMTEDDWLQVWTGRVSPQFLISKIAHNFSAILENSSFLLQEFLLTMDPFVPPVDAEQLLFVGLLWRVGVSTLKLVIASLTMALLQFSRSSPYLTITLTTWFVILIASSLLLSTVGHLSTLLLQLLQISSLFSLVSSILSALEQFRMLQCSHLRLWIGFVLVSLN